MNFTLANTLDELVAESKRLRDEAAAFDKAAKNLRADRETINGLIIAKMDDQGITRIGTGHGNVSITENTVPNVVDWDQVYEFIKDNDAFYLLQRRMSASAFNDLLTSGTQVPGTELFTKRDISLTVR